MAHNRLIIHSLDNYSLVTVNVTRREKTSLMCTRLKIHFISYTATSKFVGFKMCLKWSPSTYSIWLCELSKHCIPIIIIIPIDIKTKKLHWEGLRISNYFTLHQGDVQINYTFQKIPYKLNSVLGKDITFVRV